jgi:hypothetical protein
MNKKCPLLNVGFGWQLAFRIGSSVPWNTFATIIKVCLSLFQATTWLLKALLRAKCLETLGQAAKIRAGVSASLNPSQSFLGKRTSPNPSQLS